MDIRLLGPFEIHHNGGRVELDIRRQERLLLAVLTLEAGKVIPIDRLADLLWDGRDPATARHAIHTYMGRLRTALRPHGLEIVTAGAGYLLPADGHVLDANRFSSLARRAAKVTDPTERLRLLDDAIALWRGPFLADLADDRLRHRLAAALDELRLSSIELRAEAQLSLGLHDQAAAELPPLAEEHPTRERLAATLMIALYRSGRQAGALAAYRATRTFLVDQLGIEPGRELRSLNDRILRNDPELVRPAPAYAVKVHGQWLPWSVGGHPALEFCNTYAGWGGPPLPGSEWLRGYASLAAWAGHVGFADDATVRELLRAAEERPGEAEAVLMEARALRGHLYACLLNADDTHAFHAVAPLADEAARFAVFVRDEGGLGRWVLPPSTGLRLPLHVAAYSAADLLSDARRYTVCRCQGENCGWLFLDSTGRRKWCSPATCGQAR
ncbi:BTAD domain-containing putative transcriptional regulator [Microtetraspora fusca]|uniref:BTAD domain-containing putative transcriptional regulator n=1 Tax=Microtetraspora fusca TaxID=1997 RepID=A0ABW6VIA9_MICFU